LRGYGGKRSVVADALGISPRTLRYKLARMREVGIPIPGERGNDESGITATGAMS